MADRTDGSAALFVDFGTGFFARAESIVPDVPFIGPAARSVLNTDLLSGVVNGWLDVSRFRSGAVAIVASAGISSGSIIFEQTNDPVLAPSGATLPLREPSSIINTSVIGAQAIAASTTRIFEFPLHCRFMRIRITPAFVGGTVQAVASFSQAPLSLTALQIVNTAASQLQITAAGTAAHGAAISGNPVRTGMRAVTANPTAVATGQTADQIGTLVGVGIQKPYAIPEQGWNANLALTTATAVAIMAAAGAGLKRHITALQAINTGGAAVDIIILDGVTERWRMTLPINVPVSFPFPTEIAHTANAALNVNLSAVGTVRFCAQGYTAP